VVGGRMLITTLSINLDYKQDRGIERRLNMLLLSTSTWIVISVVGVILAVTIGMKIKDRYF
jgi:hypothetical protein